MLIPTKVEGWTVADMPLGETELVRQKVESILKYDDYVYRVYRRHNLEIGFYVAYWKAGAGDMIEIGSHSPDQCWTLGGWERVGDEEEARFPLGRQLSEVAQVRTFTKDGIIHHTIFWHIMGGKRTGYAQGEQANWGKRAPALLRSLINTKFGFMQAEQYFIRITSNRPLAEIRREPLFEELLKSAAQFGLFAVDSE